MFKFITRNPGLKIISLILAVILWLFVKSETGGEVGLVAPVEFSSLPPTLIMVRLSDEVINLRVSGSLSKVERLSTRDVRVRIDLSSAKAGLNSFDILPRNISLPQGLTVTQMSPSTIKVEIDEVMDKIVRVNALVQGEPESGYRVSRVTVDPRYIKLQGSKTQLKTLKEVPTEEIDVSGFKETVKLEVPLRLSELNVKAGGDRKVRVTVHIEPEKVEK